MSKISWTGDWLPVLHKLSPSGAGERAVAITIDDGPSDSTPELLAILARAEAKATFFLSGERIVQRPRVVQAIVDAGHAVYGHGLEHVRLEDFDQARILHDMAAAEQLLAAFRPTPEPYLVRLPYASGRREPWVHRAIRAWSPSAQVVHWSLSTEDHTISPRCAREADVAVLCQAAVDAVMESPRLDGAIILMHDQPIGVGGEFRSQVVLTLAELLTGNLARRGYAMVAVEPTPGASPWSRFLLEK